MFQRVTKSKYMDAPGYYIFILNLSHIFPGKFHMISQGKAMDMYLCSSTQDIGFGAHFPPSTLSKHFNSNGIQIMKFIIDKTNQDLVKAIIFITIQQQRFMIRFIANTTYILGTKFEKL